MDPLNDMCHALVSINNILQKRKQKIGDNSVESTETSILSQLQSTTVVDENKNNQLHLESLTEDNFHCARLFNRSIDELPNISAHDIQQLKLIHVYTMQDLLGRYLIHDTSEEFHIFLIKTFRLNEKTASTITHLLHQWTKHNLDGTRENQEN